MIWDNFENNHKVNFVVNLVVNFVVNFGNNLSGNLQAIFRHSSGIYKTVQFLIYCADYRASKIRKVLHIFD